jgi:hypothetical protein
MSARGTAAKEHVHYPDDGTVWAEGRTRNEVPIGTPGEPLPAALVRTIVKYRIAESKRRGTSAP